MATNDWCILFQCCYWLTGWQVVIVIWSRIIQINLPVWRGNCSQMLTTFCTCEWNSQNASKINIAFFIELLMSFTVKLVLEYLLPIKPYKSYRVFSFPFINFKIAISASNVTIACEMNITLRTMSSITCLNIPGNWPLALQWPKKEGEWSDHEKIQNYEQ